MQPPLPHIAGPVAMARWRRRLWMRTRSGAGVRRRRSRPALTTCGFAWSYAARRDTHRRSRRTRSDKAVPLGGHPVRLETDQVARCRTDPSDLETTVARDNARGPNTLLPAR